MTAPLSTSELQEILDLVDVDELRRDLVRFECERSLLYFVKTFWHTVEPGRALVDGWWLETWCKHLEAVTDGTITRLIGNCPPGFMKSLLTNVFWPAWEWGPKNLPEMRYVTASYSGALTERDNVRMQQVVFSELYQELWGGQFRATENKVKFANDRTGWKFATSVGGVGTGERGDRIIIDDANNIKEAESKAVLEATNQWLREVMPTRLNDARRSAIVSIQQRTNEEDATGTLLSSELTDWVHVCVPMRFEPERRCETPIWSDPREVEGELAWPERFAETELAALEETLGPYAVAGQFQQRPEPRGGGIIRDEWWQMWPPIDQEDQWYRETVGENGRKRAVLVYPDCSYVLVSIDTAYTEKEESDWSACTVWGVFQDRARNPKVMLKEAWRDRLDLHALVRRVLETCQRAQCDTLLIEAKASGLSVAQEIRRLMRDGDFLVQTIVPKGDKTARLHAVVPMFAGGLIYAPDRRWADAVRSEIAAFPKARHDDYVDSSSQALNYLRKNNLAKLSSEVESEVFEDMLWRGKREKVYDV